jgi:hypothetical protein
MQLEPLKEKNMSPIVFIIFIITIITVIIILIDLNSSINSSPKAKTPLENLIIRITSCLKDCVYKNYANDPSDKFHTDTILRPLKERYLRDIKKVKNELLQIIETKKCSKNIIDCVNHYSNLLEKLNDDFCRTYSKQQCYKYYIKKKFENLFYEFLQDNIYEINEDDEDKIIEEEK